MHVRSMMVLSLLVAALVGVSGWLGAAGLASAPVPAGSPAPDSQPSAQPDLTTPRPPDSVDVILLSPTPQPPGTLSGDVEPSAQPGTVTPLPHDSDTVEVPTSTPQSGDSVTGGNQAVTPLPADSDGDLIVDRLDNCPLSPNPEQVDSNGNGLGDPCDAPFTHGFAFVTPGGVVETNIDERLRPVQILAPAAIISLVWSDDASQVELSTQLAGESHTSALAVDLSDEALLKAVDATEAETGQDVAVFRTWLRDHPGRVLAVARGEEPPAQPSPASSFSWPRHAGLAAIQPPPVEDQLPKVRAYLDNLVSLAMEAFGTWYNFQEAHPELVTWASITRNILSDNDRLMTSFVNQELANCSPCSVSCGIDCGAGKGACYTNHPEPFPCFEVTEQDCRGRAEGVFYPGQTCPGACWMFSGGKKGCTTQVSGRDCLAIPERSRASGGEGNITTTFCGGRTCDDQIDESCRNSP